MTGARPDIVERLSAVRHLKAHHEFAYDEARKAGARRDLLLAVSAASVHVGDCDQRFGPVDEALYSVADLLRGGWNRSDVQDLVEAIYARNDNRPTSFAYDLKHAHKAVLYPATREASEWESGHNWGTEFVRLVTAHGPYQAAWDITRRRPLEFSDGRSDQDSFPALVDGASVRGIPVEDVAPHLALFTDGVEEPAYNSDTPDGYYYHHWADVLAPVLDSWAARGGERTLQLIKAGISFTEANHVDLDDGTLAVMAGLRSNP